MKLHGILSINFSHLPRGFWILICQYSFQMTWSWEGCQLYKHMIYCIIPVITEKQHATVEPTIRSYNSSPKSQCGEEKELIMKLFSVVKAFPIMSGNRTQGKKLIWTIFKHLLPKLRIFSSFKVCLWGVEKDNWVLDKGFHSWYSPCITA